MIESAETVASNEFMDPLWAGILAIIANPRRRAHWLVRNMEKTHDRVFFESFDHGQNFVRWRLPWDFHEPIKFLNDGGLAFLLPLPEPDAGAALIYRHGTDAAWRDPGLRFAAGAEIYRTGLQLYVQSGTAMFRLDGLEQAHEQPRCVRVEAPRRVL